MPITEVLRYLPYVKKIIMVGDDFQLAPLLEFRKEDVQDLPVLMRISLNSSNIFTRNLCLQKHWKKQKEADVLLSSMKLSLRKIRSQRI